MSKKTPEETEDTPAAEVPLEDSAQDSASERPLATEATGAAEALDQQVDPAAPVDKTTTRRSPRQTSFNDVALKAMSGIGKVLTKVPPSIFSPWGLAAMFVLMVYAFAPLDRMHQYFESKYQDNWHFDQSREGLIVVDTPQLFTRERLINERLEESAWIEQQLDNVDTLLTAEKFAQADSVSVTQSLLSVVGRDGSADLQGADFEKLGALADKLGTTKPTPLQQFRDAKNYRERLSLQRYDSILDDAHDIGANTLHRMNFRLTLTPARKRSDSLAAVTITVGEPSASRLLFDHYGRLVVETRKKMEETVENLLRDRMTILTGEYEFHTSELKRIDEFLKWRVVQLNLMDINLTTTPPERIEKEAERYVNKLVNRILKQQVDAQEEQARSYLFSLLNGLGMPTVLKELMPNYPEGKPNDWTGETHLTSFSVKAPRRMIEACVGPFKLTDLSPTDFALNTPRYIAMREDFVRSKMTKPSQSLQPGSAAGSSPDTMLVDAARSQPTRSEQMQSISEQHGQRQNDKSQHYAKDSQKDQAPSGQLSSEDAARQERDKFDKTFSTTFPAYSCPPRQDNVTLAKLRLIGRLDILERTAVSPFVPCEGNPVLREKLLTHIGGMPTLRDLSEIKSKFGDECPGSDLFDAATNLAERVQLSNGEYAQIGIVKIMQEKLTELPLDTSSRTVTLGQFFVFTASPCDLRSCKLRTRTRAEAILDEKNKLIRLGQSTSLQNEKLLHGSGDLLNANTEQITKPIKDIPRILTKTEADKARRLVSEEVARAGREEALRLFLELSCFADARSYTVWPRSGERLASYERDSVKSGAKFDFDSTLQKFTGLQASDTSDTVMRQERDHIFGIGDWGHPPNNRLVQDAKPGDDRSTKAKLVACSRELEQVLDTYIIDGTFLLNYAKNLTDDSLGPEVSRWWKYVDQEFRREGAGYCREEPCEMTMEILMQIAQKLRSSITQTQFSWIISPRRETPRLASRHVPLSVPLSALISLPSWWGHAELNVTTCWVRPKYLNDRIPTGNLCESPEAKGSQSSRHTMTIPLPGKAQDVLQRIGFFIIRTPYLDTQRNQEEEVEAGRPAKIRLTGSRLWKNPRVRVGNQWHDKIEVLPNMQGVIASFRCIKPTINPEQLTVRMFHEQLPRFGQEARGSDAGSTCDDAHIKAKANPDDRDAAALSMQCSKQEQSGNDAQYLDLRQAEIWTSEGRTSPTVVKVHAFRPRYFQNGEMERPCWLDDETQGQVQSVQAPVTDDNEQDKPPD